MLDPCKIWEFCPTVPTWSINWTAVLAYFPELNTKISLFTKQLCETLVQLNNWQEFTEDNRAAIFLAALWQDFPSFTNIENNQKILVNLRSKVKEARQIFWQKKIPFYFREQAVNLIRYSSLPFFIFEKYNLQHSLIKASQTVRLDLLAVLAKATVLAAKPDKEKDLIEKIELFIEFAKEENCFDQAKNFPSPHSRFIYFQKQSSDPNYLAYDDTMFKVILLSGLPASGKDTWIKQNNLANWPVISLDDIRKELKISPKKNQGEILSESKKRARELLRAKQSFIWNATNLMRSRRSQLIELFTSYKASVKIIYLEANSEELFRRNSLRQESVPKNIIEKMSANLEIPDLTEAQQVEWVID